MKKCDLIQMWRRRKIYEPLLSWVIAVRDLYSFSGIGVKQPSYESLNVFHSIILLTFSSSLVEFNFVFRDSN